VADDAEAAEAVADAEAEIEVENAEAAEAVAKAEAETDEGADAKEVMKTLFGMDLDDLEDEGAEEEDPLNEETPPNLFKEFGFTADEEEKEFEDPFTNFEDGLD